jgi:hypothetical protein
MHGQIPELLEQLLETRKKILEECLNFYGTTMSHATDDATIHIHRY